MKIQNDLLEQESDKSGKQLSSLQTTINTLEQEKSNLEQEIKQEKQKQEELNVELEQKKQEISQLTQTCSQRDESISSLDQEIQEKSTLIASLQTEIHDLKQEQISLQEKSQQEVLEKSTKIQQFEKSIEDMQMEFKIAEKKNSRIAKDLRDQLLRERKNFEKQLQFANVSKPGNSVQVEKRPTQPTPLQMSSSTSSVATTYGPSSSVKSVKIVNLTEIPQEKLQEDINYLALQLGELQSEKWKLEEQVSTQTEQLKFLKEDVKKKEQIIKLHMMDTKLQGRGSSSSDKFKAEIKNQTEKKNTGIFGGLFGPDPKVLQEMVSKMEAVLEDTLLSNMQLKVRFTIKKIYNCRMMFPF